jgi:hypothetical protein
LFSVNPSYAILNDTFSYHDAMWEIQLNSSSSTPVLEPHLLFPAESLHSPAFPADSHLDSSLWAGNQVFVQSSEYGAILEWSHSTDRWSFVEGGTDNRTITNFTGSDLNPDLFSDNLLVALFTSFDDRKGGAAYRSSPSSRFQPIANVPYILGVNRDTDDRAVVQKVAQGTTVAFILSATSNVARDGWKPNFLFVYDYDPTGDNWTTIAEDVLLNDTTGVTLDKATGLAIHDHVLYVGAGAFAWAKASGEIGVVHHHVSQSPGGILAFDLSQGYIIPLPPIMAPDAFPGDRFGNHFSLVDGVLVVSHGGSFQPCNEWCTSSTCNCDSSYAGAGPVVPHVLLFVQEASKWVPKLVLLHADSHHEWPSFVDRNGYGRNFPHRDTQVTSDGNGTLTVATFCGHGRGENYASFWRFGPSLGNGSFGAAEWAFDPVVSTSSSLGARPGGAILVACLALLVLV